MDINRTVLTGRLTRDPELHETRNGKNVCRPRLAFTTSHRVGGEWTQRSNYIDVVVFGGQAKSASRHLSKGRQVGVDGRVQWREYERQDGSKCEVHEVIADRVVFLDRPPKGSGGTQNSDGAAQPAPVVAGGAEDDDEIPF